MSKPFLVEADHPTFRRIHDFLETEKEAKELVTELKEFTYENITINGKET